VRSTSFTKEFSRKLINALLISVVLAGSPACNQTPEQKAAKFLESGKRHLEDKDYVRAVLQFRNAVRTLPKDPEARYQLGMAYLAAGSLQEGVKELLEATKLDPKHAGAQVALAGLLARRLWRKAKSALARR
jgi:cytochrome c-type biogenesis protein CcmH/NrfG